MRKALAALALAGSSVAFAEHKAFQEKYIIGCSTEQIATANSITDSFRTCAEELYGAGTIQEVSRSGGAQPVVSAMDEDEMAMARKKEGGLMAADDADEI